MSQYALALDVGGTFTDVIMVEPASGALWTTKTPSTPADPSTGFFDGVDKVLGRADAKAADVTSLFHGSTVATNAILEAKGAATGMIVTDGFKYVLEIGRHDIPRKENLYSWVKPARPIPPRLIMEVPERVQLDGSVARPVDEDACREAALRLKQRGVQSVAIVFLHAYANPAHERRAAEIVREVFPEAQISISSDVLPVFREYERSVVTALNAYVQPKVGSYIEKLSGGLKAREVSSPLLIMKSNGGVFSPSRAAKRAVDLALSGPAAGVIGARYVGDLTGMKNAITIDIGGTSADISLIENGRAQMTNDGEIGPFPLPIPIVDIHTIGAGGGSIAAVSDQGGLTVGPESAGASPGPACYGQGGERPTVTDANLVLGRIPPHLLGGEIPLDTERAERAVREHVAEPLGLDLHQAALGILKIVNSNMVGALKVVSVEKGYDPQDFALVAFGGAGPMHAGDLARLLGTQSFVIPPYPGILCAMGLLATDLQLDYVRTQVQRAPNYDLAGMEATYAAMAAEAAADLAAEGVPAERQQSQRFADLRYAKQGYELTVAFPGDTVTGEAVAALVEEFHRRHEQLYTFSDADAPVEIVNLRLRAVGLVDKIDLPKAPAADGGATPRGNRQVWFDDKGPTETPVFDRIDLAAGQTIDGPAIVDQADTTTVISPDQRARVDDYGNLVVTTERR